MVRVVKQEPHPSVVKEVICRNCGATLEYVPMDIKERVEVDYGGGRDLIKYIECPACSYHQSVKGF
jgi:ribosomal protein S27E